MSTHRTRLQDPQQQQQQSALLHGAGGARGGPGSGVGGGVLHGPVFANHTHHPLLASLPPLSPDASNGLGRRTGVGAGGGGGGGGTSWLLNPAGTAGSAYSDCSRSSSDDSSSFSHGAPAGAAPVACHYGDGDGRHRGAAGEDSDSYSDCTDDSLSHDTESTTDRLPHAGGGAGPPGPFAYATGGSGSPALLQPQVRLPVQPREPPPPAASPPAGAAAGSNKRRQFLQGNVQPLVGSGHGNTFLNGYPSLNGGRGGAGGRGTALSPPPAQPPTAAAAPALLLQQPPSPPPPQRPAPTTPGESKSVTYFLHGRRQSMAEGGSTTTGTPTATTASLLGARQQQGAALLAPLHPPLSPRTPHGGGGSPLYGSDDDDSLDGADGDASLDDLLAAEADDQRRARLERKRDKRQRRKERRRRRRKRRLETVVNKSMQNISHIGHLGRTMVAGGRHRRASQAGTPDGGGGDRRWTDPREELDGGRKHGADSSSSSSSLSSVATDPTTDTEEDALHEGAVKGLGAGAEREQMHDKQVQIMRGKWKGRYQVISNFKLEALSGGHLKFTMAVFYFSIALAFATKIYSEMVMQIDNICDVGGNHVSTSAWNSSTCMAQYGINETIPISYVPGVASIICPSSLCLKWTATIPTLSVLNKMYFIGFTVDDFAPNATSFNADLRFAGFSHILDGGGRPLDDGELLPPSAFHQRNITYSNDTDWWNPHTSSFSCKKKNKCDYGVFPEPIYATSRPRHLQLLLLNADEIEPVLAASGKVPSVAVIYAFWLESLFELVVRYFGMLLAIYFIIMYTHVLGVLNFFQMRPHFRQHGALRSKPWMLEQKWTLIVLFFSILYLNPAKLASMYYFSRKGLVLDGPGWTWNDRIFYFVDVNLPAYFINLLRMFELLIFSCCFEKPPKFSIWPRDYRRAWPYWFFCVWYITFLLQDWIRIKTTYKASYVTESSDTGVWQGNLIANSVVFTVLVSTWMAAMVYYFVRASRTLLRRHYWKTKSRQLSFRLFVMLYVWQATYVIASVVYCWYQFQFGRALLEDMVCHNVTTGHTVGDTISNIVFVLIFAYFYHPVVFKSGQAPPDALDREWVTTRWKKLWIRYVNHQSNSTMYFFLWESERKMFNEANGVRTAPRPKLLNAALKKMREKVKDGKQKVEHGRKKLGQGLDQASEQFNRTRKRIRTQLMDSQLTQSFMRYGDVGHCLIFFFLLSFSPIFTIFLFFSFLSFPAEGVEQKTK